MKKVLLFLCLFSFITGAFCQVDSTIRIERKKILINGSQVKPKQLQKILAANPASYPDYKIYKKNMTIGTTVMMVGTTAVLAGAIMNFAGTVKQANDLNNGEVSSGNNTAALGIMLVGAAIDLVAIPFVLKGNKHFKKSISEYNSSLKKTSSNPMQLNIVFSSNGLGVRMNF
jgi:hypothetical protein